MALTLSGICLNLLLLQWLNCNPEGNGLIPLNEFTLLLSALLFADTDVIALQTSFFFTICFKHPVATVGSVGWML